MRSGNPVTNPKKLVNVWETDTTLRVPESVLYDGKDKVLYVANIDGNADALDGNGFISKASLTGKIENLRNRTGGCFLHCYHFRIRLCTAI